MIGRVVRDFLPKRDLLSPISRRSCGSIISRPPDNKYKARVKILVHENRT